MKDDAETPASVPRKRRELERALDKWLAVWATDESQPPGDRKRAQAERDRRKRAHPDPVVLGVLVGHEGATPAQLDVMRELANQPGVVEVRAPFPLRLGVKAGAFAVQAPGRFPVLQEIVRASTTVVAAPKEPEKPTVVSGVWEAVRYAKHRGLAVKVVMPDGDERG